VTSAFPQVPSHTPHLVTRDNIINRRADIFIKFRLLGSKISDVLIKNVKTISRLGVRPGGTACVGVTSVNNSSRAENA
jgi:hypothetical protein